jgi:hypothetical protein
MTTPPPVNPGAGDPVATPWRALYVVPVSLSRNLVSSGACAAVVAVRFTDSGLDSDGDHRAGVEFV